jgi:hypothetical protein
MTQGPSDETRLTCSAKEKNSSGMDRPGFQISVASMLGVVACIAFNIWLFRLGVLWGILGLNLSKHVVIAYLCQVLGVGRQRPGDGVAATDAPPPCPVTAAGSVPLR